MKVALFIPCFVDAAFPNVGRATVRVLERLGVEVHYPPGQTCCGQPAFNAGHWDEARAVAGHMLDVFDRPRDAAAHATRDAGAATEVNAAIDVDAIVCPAGSCAAMAKVSYGKLFEGEPRAPQAAAVSARVWELSDFLVRKLGVTDVGSRFVGSVTFHDACHALRELRIADAPRRLLRAIPGVELREMDAAQECCGFGGTFAIKHAPISAAMGDGKVASVRRTAADVVTSLDATCLAQIGGLLDRDGAPVRTMHLAEILAGPEDDQDDRTGAAP